MLRLGSCVKLPASVQEFTCTELANSSFDTNFMHLVQIANKRQDWRGHQDGLPK